MLEELRHLVLIVEHGTFTEAARRAHLSQPALSASVRRLEEQLGARLFERSRSGAVLTAAGEALLPRARAALAAVEDGRRAVAELAKLEAGEVRVGAGATACTYYLPPVLAVYRQRYPGVHIRLRELFKTRMVERLRDGSLDLGIVSGPGDDPWREDELIVVAAPSCPPESTAFLTFAEGSATRALLLESFPDVEIAMELGSIAAIVGHVAAGIGKALVSRAAVAGDLDAGRLIEVPTPRTPIRRQLSLIHRGVGRMPPAAAALRDLLLSGSERPPDDAADADAGGAGAEQG